MIVNRTAADAAGAEPAAAHRIMVAEIQGHATQ